MCRDISTSHTTLQSRAIPNFPASNTSTVFLLKSLDYDTDLGCGNNQQLCASLGIEIFHKKNQKRYTQFPSRVGSNDEAKMGISGLAVTICSVLGRFSWDQVPHCTG